MNSDAPTPFRLWGRIEHIGPQEFAVIVTAMPENADPALVQVLNAIATSRDEATVLGKALLVKMGEIVRNREGRVTDIEIDGF